MALLALTLVMMFAATLMSGTEAQQPPVRNCSVVFEELTGKGIRVFVEANATQNLKNELCVNRETSRLERYVYCPEGESARVLGYDTADTKSDLSKVVNIDELRDQLNNSNIILLCVPRPQPPTPSPTPPPPPPGPASIGRCPRGPTRVNQYLRQDQPKLCQQRCSFGTAVFGISIGSRSRTIYRCCDGEPIRVSRASRLYRCP